MAPEARINVTAHRKINSKKENLYSGKMRFHYGKDRTDYVDNDFPSLMNERGAVSPGFFRNLEDLAESINLNVRSIIDESVDPDLIVDLILSYDSNISDNGVSGSRGYTDFSGSYLHRPLTSNEMKSLMLEVDRKLRPLLLESEKRNLEEMR